MDTPITGKHRDAGMSLADLIARAHYAHEEYARKMEYYALQREVDAKLSQFSDDLLDAMIQHAPVELRLRGLSLEERLAGISKEDEAKLLELVEPMHRQ
jgi:hypothetical protein